MSFTNEYCLAVEVALEHKFPGIQATCESDSEGGYEIVFEEGKYTQMQVREFLRTFKKGFDYKKILNDPKFKSMRNNFLEDLLNYGQARL